MPNGEAPGAVAQALVIVVLALVIKLLQGAGASVEALGINSVVLVDATIILALVAALLYAIHAILLTLKGLSDAAKTLKG